MSNTDENCIVISPYAAESDRMDAMPTFDEQLSRLNTDQRRAVETIEGPVMVIAGPGTGKTQTVSMRVANILRKTQMRPGNILCLTFSVSGATAMRDRLRSLIGPDAYGVTVRTIHGFCQDIISDNPVLFDEWSAGQQISDIDRYREMNAIIESFLPGLAIVNPKNPYARTRDILDRISQVKKEGKSEEDLRRVAAEYENEMAGKSKPGTKVHEKNLLAAKKFAEFVELFVRYQHMLSETGRYDYDDMILYVIRALEKEEWLLLSLQERFQYVLVDEFQDTNGSQYRVIELLTTYVNVPQEPNLFVVGDDDQAIYRFQGANLNNILSFHQRFPKAAIITLTTSYRSTQAILDAAGRLIAHNTERLVGRIEGLEKILTSASGEKGTAPLMLRPPSDMAEPWMVADIVEDRLKQGTKPDDIAILTQTNGELRTFYDVLHGRGIPVRMTGKADLLQHPLILQALAILRAVSSPQKDALLGDALGAECLHCHPADIGRLFRIAREQKKRLLDCLLALDQESPLFEGMTFSNKDKLLWTRDWILDLHQKLATRTVIETVERVLHDGGLLAKGRDIHPLDLAALQEFFDRTRSRMIEQPGYTFDVFLRDLEFYTNPDYGQLRMTYDLPHLVTEGVQLLTAHQSKGQEFTTVILVNFREGHWDKRRNPASLSLPEELLFGWVKDQKTFEQHQDERRVAFVAMTRAKTELIFSCPKELTSGERTKSVSPSAFFAEAGPLPEEDRDIRDPEHAATLLLKPPMTFDDDMRAFLQERLKTFSLSASALNRFLEDPTEFLRVDLLQVPQLTEYALAYGNAVHWALKQWALRMQRGAPMGQDEFLGEFRNFLLEREFLTDGELKRLMHLGEESLPRYFEQRLAKSTPYIERVETGLNARLGDIPIKGKIDRIDRDHPESASGVVIDYKTGRPQTESQIREGDYFRQLQFYAVLIDEAYPSLTPRAFILDFVGEREEHPVERVFQISEQDKTEMKKLIRDVWTKIIALDFSPL